MTTLIYMTLKKFNCCETLIVVVIFFGFCIPSKSRIFYLFPECWSLQYLEMPYLAIILTVFTVIANNNYLLTILIINFFFYDSLWIHHTWQNYYQSELRELRKHYGITETLWHYGTLWHYVTKIRNIRKSKNNYGKQVYKVNLQ